MAKTKVIKNNKKSPDFFERIQTDLENRQSFLSLILGALIVIVLGVLLYNYFNKPQGELGPSQQSNPAKTEATADVKKDQLPGKYTVKDGDTLYLIAQKYYDDGYKYPSLVEENKLADENVITVGQVLDIPKLDTANQSVPSATNSATLNAENTQTIISDQTMGTGGAENQTIWGEKITGDTYTVTDGDWLSKIAGRAYGDIYAFDKIAKANNIQNPDTIEVGTVLQIPR
ncbi:LysM peptidoglycan-binding domain-containing protein [Candidatus Daviesbacteria bacterium]|nr:LysM peptidoglycan-binding domain-containing protein [Candidatus Daviesbacteria bacterium]